MKHKRVYIAYLVNQDDGSFEQHPAFEGKEFLSPQSIFGEIIDTEQRVSSALASRKPPEKADQKFLEDISGTEIAIIETFTFESDERKDLLNSRQLIEPTGGTGGDDRFAKMQKEIDRLTRENTAAKKSPAAEKK